MRVFDNNLFSSRQISGVFHVLDIKHIDVIERKSTANDFLYVEIDGSKVTGASQVLALLNDALYPPISVANNWDALESQLKSLDWIQSLGVTIVFREFTAFQKANPGDFDIFMEIVYSVIHLKTYRSNSRSKGLYFIFYSHEDVQLPTMNLIVPTLFVSN